MFLGTNLQYLRRRNNGMTQEKLAQRMGVSRQTISKWESGEAYPEVGNLMELCEIFSCKLDELLREDLTALPSSTVRLVMVERFRMAQYVIISTQAKKDVLSFMDNWARESGLLSYPGYVPQRIHWGFPYVSAEQKNRFGLRGYAAVYILPEGFVAESGGVEIKEQKAASYAVMTLHANKSNDIPDATQVYPQIIEYLSRAGVSRSATEGYLPCFEREYEKDGLVYKDVFVHCEDTETTEIYRFR